MARLYRSLLLRGWWLVVALLLGGGAFLGSRIGGLNIDAGTNVLLNEEDPDLAYYNRTRPEWGYDEYAIVCVTRDDWFTPEGVAALQELTAALRRGPYVASVTSILDVPLLRNNPFVPVPTSLGAAGCHLGRAKKELLEHTMARGNLVSPDGRSVAVLVYLDIPPETRRIDPLWSRLQGERWMRPEAAAEIEALRPQAEAANAELKRRRFEMMRGIRAVAAEWTSKLAEPVRLAGVPVINLNLVEHVRFDLKTFGLASLALFLLAFFAVYRRVRWVALPILTCLLPPTLIVGWMAWTGMKISVITSNLPVLLFVLLLPYTVYWIERYRERRAASPGEDAVESTLGAARAVWVPCLFSCLTTMAGVASLMTSGIVPVHTFGRMMTIGMVVGLACVFLFLPAASMPLAGVTVAWAGPSRKAGGLVRLFEVATLRAPWGVVAASAVVLGVSAWGATRLNAETKFTDYFRRGSEIYEGLEFIDKRMGGTTSIEILLRSAEPGFFRTDAGLAALAAATRYFDRVPETGNIRSFHLLANEVRKSFPKLRTEAIAEQLRLLAPDLVREFVNEDFSVSRIFVRMRETAPTLHRNRILAGLREHLAAQPELRGLAEVRPTGIFLLYANMLNSLMESQRDTFAVVMAAVFAMLLILFRSPILAGIVLLPQVLPAVAVLGAMGWFGIPLDLVTVMIASIAMGVGIDAAIQYTMRYRAELAAAGGDRHAAVSRAHATIGRAIWIATSMIVAGFCVLALSRFVPTVYFGVFTALAMLVGQFAALTTLPALFLVTGRPRVRPAPRPGLATVSENRGASPPEPP